MEKNMKDLASFLTGAWMFLMLAVLPLYFRDRYQEIGACKFQIFEWSSKFLIVPAAVLLVLLGLWKWRKSLWDIWRDLSGMDWFVLAYAAANIVSFCLSGNRETAYTGVSGWSMGLRTQLFMAAAYFCISRLMPKHKIVLYGHFAASSAAFLLGVLHRFQIDPLGMYRGIDEVYFLQFLSTIGQATWFSSYVCVVFPVGLILYFRSRVPWQQFLLGIYCMLGFMTVVTQNSDSAFAAMIFVLTGLFVLGCRSMERMERFLQILVMMLASFKIIGFFQFGFPDRAIELGALPTFLTQSPVTWGALIAVILLYIGFLFFQQGKTDEIGDAIAEVPHAGKLRILMPSMLAAGVIGAAALIWLNTSGLLLRWFGWQSQNSYLLFDEKWGSNRGYNWSFAGKVFAELPPVSKLFGVGPDCFYPYCYGRSDYGSELRRFWGNMNLTNAHNEFLNLLICIGVVGTAVFAGMLVCAVIRYTKNSETHPLAAVGALAVLAYAAHNFFCYQQVCCTPFLFLLLGVSEYFVRNGRENGTEGREKTDESEGCGTAAGTKKISGGKA